MSFIRRFARTTLIAAMLAATAVAPGIATSATPAQPQHPVRPDAAAQVVESLHAALIDVMRNASTLGWEGRFQRLDPVLKSAYSFPDMARIAAGSHWKTFTDAQKQALTDAFARMSTATYATRFDDYGGERFEIVGVDELPAPNSGLMVRTRLIRSNGEDVNLTYRLEQTETGWRIVDVFYRGTVSELATQRSQYLTILRTAGYDGLMNKLESKVADLAAGRAKE